jgi:acetyl-CoA acetyltransferase
MPKHAVISGVHNTKVGSVPDSTVMSLHSEAAFGALADAGLKLSDIDGVLCAYAITETYPMLSSAFCEYVGVAPNFNAGLHGGGATAAMMAMQATALVRNGDCRHVLCVAGENRLTGMTRDKAVAALAEFGHPQFEQPYGVNIPAAYALVAQRYLHETGATLEHLAALAVLHRTHAAMHPDAHMTEAITLDDVANARTISDPLRLLDCCLISDGGAAFIVSAGETAGDMKKSNPAILGAGQGHTHEHILAAPSLTSFGCKMSSATAFGKAGVTTSDIDVAEIYDSFTITLLIELESIGFYEKGEAGEAALRGELTHGGKMPCNTHGGLLSFGHSGAAGGMFHIVEAVRQLRGEADIRQVPDANLAFVHGDGGILSAHCSMILGNT